MYRRDYGDGGALRTACGYSNSELNEKETHRNET